MTSVVRIGCAGGMWGDDLDAPRRLVEGAPLDYLMLDYLAEVTMSILQKQRARDPRAGFARDFPATVVSVLPAIRTRGLRVLADAGGVNPVGCGDAVRDAIAKAGAAGEVRVGVVTGDDLLPRLDALLAAGHELRNMDTGEPLAAVRDRVVAANAYIGADGLVAALDQGAQVVVTGRCADASLCLAPLVHEYHWPADDWDRRAAGMIAGHIIECGAQCTGGNCLHDWESIPDLANVGYPIVEVAADGTFVVTKPEGSGGRVSVLSVTEQLVYEIGDPRAYLTPDVSCDFTGLALTQAAPDRVAVRGARGTPKPAQLKVSIAYTAGYKAIGTLTYAWPDALAKAQRADAVLRERLDRAGLRFDAIVSEFVGAGATHGTVAPQTELPEVGYRIGVRDADKAKVDRFTREVAPLVLNGPPSATGYAQARGKVEEVVAFWPALIDRQAVDVHVEVRA
ncbi:MAG: DUF1446 domain-containing protein [Gemmatimonadaceae bacterium]|nr:DUF1446 domain-containing protein [Gemmatimonadaceae bacterium]